MASNSSRIDLVAVGDSNVGKTYLFLTFASDKYIERPFKPVPDEVPYNWTIDVDGTDRKVGVWDTCGMDDYTKLRQIYYPYADCFLLCYEISNRNSFENITSKWIPEIQSFLIKRIPLILVGMKSDCRNDGFVTVDEAIQLKEAIGASAFFECSAKNNENIVEILKEAVRAVDQKRKRKKYCVLL